MNGYRAAYEAAKLERSEIRATIEKLLARSEMLGNVLESLTPILVDDGEETPEAGTPGAEVEMFPIPMPEAQVHA
jgi:hypothetical protein